MKLYNTLSKQEELVNDGTVRIYSCGPTVYDRAHIGNLASFIYADTLGRVLRASGATVKYVMNLTDIDDKTITRSRQAHADMPPMEALGKLTSFYEDYFVQDLQKIGVDTTAITFVRATDHISEMQLLIRSLVDKGFAYVKDDGVYFSIDAYIQSGKTYGQLVEITSMSTGAARVNNDEYDKDHIHDFALWKKQKAQEPAWDFEVDGHDMSGRPGWHIECSAMSASTLGIPFDIHTGGVDLKFPHHENEIAQSTALTAEATFSHIFMHSEHILIEGQKMSKSLQNFLTLEDITVHASPSAFRLFILEGHYRNQRNFSFEILQASVNRLRRWKQQAAVVSLSELNNTSPTINQELLKPFLNDLNTPLGISVLDQKLNQYSSDDTKHSELVSLIMLIDEVLGISLVSTDDSEHIDELLTARETARANKEWAKADAIRSQLEEMGIGVSDSDTGPVWYKL